MSTAIKLASLQGILLQLVGNRPEGHALSWGDIQKARDSAGDVPDEILEPVLTWLGVDHPLRPPEKHTRWASPGEYQREVMADITEIIRDLPRDKVKTYLEALDPDDLEKEVDWSEFGDDFDTRLDETADQAVTYTARQYEILLWSHNESAIDDVGAELGEDSSSAISAMAYYAYRQDLTDAISISNSELAERHGFRLDLDEDGDTKVVDLRA
jgi:hypothetical protein